MYKVERAMRPIAISRKSWLFVGSQRAGARAAVLASQVASCKNNLVEPWAYLKNVYTRLADDPTGDQLTELPPDIWLNKNPTQRWEIAEKRKTERDAKALSLVRLRLQRPRSDEFDRVMWQHLRNRQSCQQKFRVEHSLRIYVANFDRLAAKLNVEIDGPVHPSAGPRQYDSVRKQVDACLTAICRSSWALSNQSTLQYFLLESLNDRNLIQPWRCVGFVFIKGAGGTRKS